MNILKTTVSKNFRLAAIMLLCSSAFSLAADAQVGEAIYANHCAECHGEGLRNPGSSFDLKLLKEHERERFNASVSGGKGQMPPWKGVLNDDDLDALWAYIRMNAYD